MLGTISLTKSTLTRNECGIQGQNYVAWLQRSKILWEVGEVKRWKRWKDNEVAKWERQNNGEVGRWEVPGFIQGWGTQGESNISSFCF